MIFLKSISTHQKKIFGKNKNHAQFLYHKNQWKNTRPFDFGTFCYFQPYLIFKLPNTWTMIMQSFVVLFWLCLIENGIVNSLFNLWSSRPSFSFQRGRKTFKTLDLKIQTRESKSKNIGSFFSQGKNKNICSTYF